MAWNRKKRLNLVTDKEATGFVAEVFSDLGYALGVPFTPTYYQALGFYPDFLKIHWQSLKPVLQTKEFFDQADRLHAEAYTAVHNYFRVPDLCLCLRNAQFSEGAQRELSAAIDFFSYRDAVILLICATQCIAFEGPSSAQPPRPLETLKRPPELPANAPVLVPDGSLSPAVRKVFEEIRRNLDLPVVTTDYFALARWPDFIQDFWRALKPNANTMLYSEHRRRIGDSALSLASNAPPLSALSMQALEERGLSKDAVTSLVHINQAFFEAFSANLLNVTFAQIGLEGGNGRGLDFRKAA